LFLLPILFWGFRKRSAETTNTNETAPLLGQPGTQGEYGTIVHIGNSDDEDSRKEREFQERVKKRREEGGWLEYAKSFKVRIISHGIKHIHDC